MPFNPTLPVVNSLIDADELRNQFNGLKELIDQMQTTIESLQTSLNLLSDETAQNLSDRPTYANMPGVVEAYSARSINGMSDLTVSFSDPPTSTELEQVVEKLNALIVALQA